MKSFIFLLVAFSAAYAAPGVKSQDTRLGIIGGRDAKIGEVKWIASLQECFLSMICRPVCGAAILSPKWVVTAAHCLGLDWTMTHRIVTGVLDLNEYHKYKQVEDVILRVVHPLFDEYNNNIQTNDIALLKLWGELELNEITRPIALPVQGLIPAEVNGDFAGWGSIAPDVENPVNPRRLQTAVLPIISIDDCSNAIDSLIPNNNIPLDMNGGNICVGPLPGGVSPCIGDNGGPLVVNATLVAIASWVFDPCGSEGAPTVFTNIGGYVDWIKEYVTDI